jgi:hypothetical protein
MKAISFEKQNQVNDASRPVNDDHLLQVGLAGVLLLSAAFTQAALYLIDPFCESLDRSGLGEDLFASSTYLSLVTLLWLILLAHTLLRLAVIAFDYIKCVAIRHEPVWFVQGFLLVAVAAGANVVPGM